MIELLNNLTTNDFIKAIHSFWPWFNPKTPYWFHSTIQGSSPYLEQYFPFFRRMVAYFSNDTFNYYFNEKTGMIILDGTEWPDQKEALGYMAQHYYISDTTKLILTYQSKKITIEKNAISLWDIFQSMTFLIDNPIEHNISFQPPNTFKID